MWCDNPSGCTTYIKSNTAVRKGKTMTNLTQLPLVGGVARAAKRTGLRIAALAKSEPVPCWSEYLRETRK